MRMDTNRDREALQAATLFRLAARTPEEEAYFRGYGSGVSRRLSGGIGPDEREAVAFELTRDAPDEATKTLGIGYRDGLAGEPLRDRRGEWLREGQR